MRHHPVVGQPLIIEMEYRNEGVLTDPAVVRCYIRKPSGAFVELAYPSTELVKRSVGVFEASVVPDEPGTWAFRGSGTGGVDAVSEVSISVENSLVINPPSVAPSGGSVIPVYG